MTNRELFRVSKRRLCELTSQYYEPVTLKEVAYEKVSKHFGYFLFFMNQNQHEVKVFLFLLYHKVHQKPLGEASDDD